jgi:hypothetical protein
VIPSGLSWQEVETAVVLFVFSIGAGAAGVLSYMRGFRAGYEKRRKEERL